MQKKKAAAKSTRRGASKKPGTGVARKKTGGAVRPSRLNKFVAKIEKLPGGKLTEKALSNLTAQATVTVVQPQQVFGTVVVSNDNYVVLRTQLKAGSSKPAVKTFQRTEIISELIDGTNALLSVFAPVEVFATKDANVQYEVNSVLITDNKTGDTVRFPTNDPRVDVQVAMFES
jgi:hypothetical protein